MKQSWSFVTITEVGGCYLDAQYASNRPRRPFRDRSSMARKKIATEAPAIAPDDDGAQDSNKRLSPPFVWKYGNMVLDRSGRVGVGLNRERGILYPSCYGNNTPPPINTRLGV